MRFNKLDTRHFFDRLRLYIFHNPTRDNEISIMNYILRVEGVSKDFSPALSLRQLCALDFKYKKSIRALQDISFALKRNKIMCILGLNGAGKTTLLKIISQLVLADKGKVFVNGSYREEEIKSSVGLLLDEERSFYWRLTGRQNLEFFAALYGLQNAQIKARIEELLALFGLDYADRRFDTYSTGMKRNFSLLRTLLHEPELMLLDEPTKSLDYLSTLKVKRFIKDELLGRQRKSIIFTTHQIREAADLAELLLILHKGKIRGYGTLEELREKINMPQATLEDIFMRLTSES